MATRQEREAKRRAHEAEIRKKLEEVNAKRDPNTPRKGRSSMQGVKLLYIRDYLRENTNEDHPKNAIEISKYLAGQGIKADRKTIYNDIERLIEDFKEPIEYTSGKKRGYYISEPQFEPYELRLLVDCIRMAPCPTEEEAELLTSKVKELSNIYDRYALDIHPLMPELKRPKASVAKNVDILYRAIALKKKVSFRLANRIPAHGYQTKNLINKQNNTEVFIVSPKEILWSRGLYLLRCYVAKDAPIRMYMVEMMRDIKILTLDYEENPEYRPPSKEKTQAMRAVLDSYFEEYLITVCIHNNHLGAVLKEFGDDILMIPEDEKHFTINVRRTKFAWPQLFGWIAGLNGDAWITQPQEAIDGMNAFLSRLLEAYNDIASKGNSPQTL